jgi:Tfp pilus assembly protein PilF
VQVLEELADAQPDDPRHLTRKGSCLIEMGRWSEARQTLQQALRLRPDFAPAHLLLATTYLESGDDLAAAQRHAQQAVALAPTPSTQAFLVLAAVLQQQGDLQGARTTLRKAVATDPNNMDLRRAYEQLLATD